MHPLIQLKKATSIFLVAFGLTCFGLAPTAQAQLPPPPPDGGYPNGNTAEGTNALFSLTTGSDNTATGANALLNNTIGGSNTATGVQTLLDNTTGGNNTAIGFQALLHNSTGNNNTATGVLALLHNTTANNNTATGSSALSNNTTGTDNTATGFNALINNTMGGSNTATGFQTLASNTTGGNNTATGENALFFNSIGFNNTAEGFQALLHNTGSSNIAVGSNAGLNLTTGSNNIDIDNGGVAAESNHIRIGTVGTQTKTFIAGVHGATASGGAAVFVNSAGQLGTLTSSARFKQDIKPMDKASEAILSLKPVTFHYKKEIDPDATSQFGLVAEEVAKVNPDLVARDAQGKPYTVRYDAVNAMLLNEFLKEHQTVQELKKQVAELTAGLQKLSAQLEVSKAAPQTVLNNQQ